MTFFTEENIIEPLMSNYKDFKYVEYILNLPFERGFKLYLKCIDNIKQDIEKELKDNIRQIWLIEIQHGCKSDFETYYKSKCTTSENRTLGKDVRNAEEERIINEMTDKENIKLQERKVVI